MDDIKTRCRGRHAPGDGSWWAKDGQGIELCRVCDDCIEQKLAHFREEILEPYTQNDVNEPIEEQ